MVDSLELYHNRHGAAGSTIELSCERGIRSSSFTGIKLERIIGSHKLPCTGVAKSVIYSGDGGRFNTDNDLTPGRTFVQ